MFVEKAGEIYRILIKSFDGAWVISYTNPSAPSFMSNSNIETAHRIETPKEYLDALNLPLTAARLKRKTIIKSLLEDERNITDAQFRINSIKLIAKEFNINYKNIANIYYRYLATGILTSTKSSTRQVLYKKEFDYAINTFYFSAKRVSLKVAYSLMLKELFTDSNNKLVSEYPSWYSFKHYYYRYRANTDVNRLKVITREGLGEYQRNHRNLKGTVVEWRQNIGTYQMDATIADIYLVSRADRTKQVGRPYIYLAVDTATTLITGVYVGFKGGADAVLACLANAAMDKVEYCKSYGINIYSEDWPSIGVPSEIVTDKGNDFISKDVDVFCQRFGVERMALDAFRPDKKGCVEKAFDLLQSQYKPLLRGKGVVECDSNERWSIDYKKQATLNLDEFIRIIIHCIIYINSGRILNNINYLNERVCTTASGLWAKYTNEGKTNLLDVNFNDVYISSLPKQEIILTKKGIKYNGLSYIPEQWKGLITSKKYEVGIDEQNVSNVYLYNGNQVIKCNLSYRDRRLADLTKAELDIEKAEMRKLRKEKTEQELQAQIDLRNRIILISDRANEEKSKK